MVRERWGVTSGLLVSLFSLCFSVFTQELPTCVPDQFLVMYRDAETAQEITGELAASLPGIILQTSDFPLPSISDVNGKAVQGTRVMVHCIIERGKATELPEVVEICDDLRGKDNVIWAEPVAYGFSLEEPADPLYHAHDHIASGLYDQWALRKIRCPEAWEISEGSGTVVAVLDSGLDYEHEDIYNDGYAGPLRDRIWVNTQEDWHPDQPPGQRKIEYGLGEDPLTWMES